MKKIILLFSIACVGQLYGMSELKPEIGHYTGMEELSPEVKVMIISMLNSYNNLDEIIKAVKALSETNSELNAIINDLYGNQKGFIKLVHMLAKKFNASTEDIAIKIGTSAAEKYCRLGTELMNVILAEALVVGPDAVINKINQLIKEGADVNYTSYGTGKQLSTPLKYAVIRLYSDIVKLLLNAGAIPDQSLLKYHKFLMRNLKGIQHKRAVLIQQMLEEVLKK